MFWSYSRSFFKEYLNLIILGGLQYMKQFLICCLNNPTFIVSAAATHFICIAWLELIYQSKKIDSSGGISRTTVYISIHDYIIHIHFNSRHWIDVTDKVLLFFKFWILFLLNTGWPGSSGEMCRRWVSRSSNRTLVIKLRWWRVWSLHCCLSLCITGTGELSWTLHSQPGKS